MYPQHYIMVNAICNHRLLLKIKCDCFELMHSLVSKVIVNDSWCCNCLVWRTFFFNIVAIKRPCDTSTEMRTRYKFNTQILTEWLSMNLVGKYLTFKYTLLEAYLLLEASRGAEAHSVTLKATGCGYIKNYIFMSLLWCWGKARR